MCPACRSVDRETLEASDVTDLTSLGAGNECNTSRGQAGQNLESSQAPVVDQARGIRGSSRLGFLSSFFLASSLPSRFRLTTPSRLDERRTGRILATGLKAESSARAPSRKVEQRPLMRYVLIFMVLMTTGAQAGVVEDYLDAYFEMFPTRATAAGLHERDDALEDLSPKKLSEWVAINRGVVGKLETALRDPDLDFDDRLDAELLLREAELQVLDLDTLRRPQRNPLFWTDIVSQATVFLLVREDRPRPERLAAVASRAEQIPRLVAQARAALGGTPKDEIAPELCRWAAHQAGASAQFYAEGLAAVTTEDDDASLRQRLVSSGIVAAQALSGLSTFLEGLAGGATGSSRLGESYRLRFEIVNGIDTPLADVLSEAETDLAAKIREAAEFGRSVWAEVMGDEEPPAGDKQLLQALFHRVSEDRAA